MKILFVDDEIQVLKGLRRMLATVDDDWDPEFANSGAEALEILAEDEFDVVVTDMRMPRMDGAQLLQQVSTKYPDIVRIVLSGQADQVSVLRAVNPMHQYLSKPCDPDKLRTTITRACELRDVLQSDELQELVSRVTTVPAMPALYNDVVAEIESPDGNLARIGELIAQDPGMSAKILQITNSAIFAMRSPIYSPVHAASLLGMDAIKSLVLSLGVFEQLDRVAVPNFSIEAVFQHCVQVGGNARLIATSQRCEEAVVACAFTAGMLQDLGVLVLASGMPEAYGEVIKTARNGVRSLADVETEALGASHAAVGAYLLELWGLPQSMAETVAFHETPELGHDTEFTALSAVVAANLLTPSEKYPELAGDAARQRKYLAQLGLLENLTDWRELCLQADEVPAE